MHEGKFCVKINPVSAADGLLRFLAFHLQGTGSGEKCGRILGCTPEGEGVVKRPAGSNTFLRDLAPEVASGPTRVLEFQAGIKVLLFAPDLYFHAHLLAVVKEGVESPTPQGLLPKQTFELTLQDSVGSRIQRRQPSPGSSTAGTGRVSY